VRSGNGYILVEIFDVNVRSICRLMQYSRTKFNSSSVDGCVDSLDRDAAGRAVIS